MCFGMARSLQRMSETHYIEAPRQRHHPPHAGPHRARERNGMSSMRRDLDGFVVVTMVLLCAIWGAQQVAIKLAEHDVVPIMQVGLRSSMSAALVLLLMAIRGEKV